MFAKFNPKLGKNELKYNENLYTVGREMYTSQKKTVHSNRCKYLAPNGSLDASFQ